MIRKRLAAALALLCVCLPAGDAILGFSRLSCRDPCVEGSEDIMNPKDHGTSRTGVQKNLKWDVDRKIADRIANYNRTWPAAEVD